MDSLRKIVRNILAENVQNPPVSYLFHGTSDIYLDSIMKNGLNSPYLTSNYEKAGYYADEVSQENGGEPIILKVKISNTNNLRVDFNELDEPVMTDKSAIQKAYKKYMQQKPESFDKKYKTINVDKHDYWISLTSTQTVRYEGIIPSSNISFDGNNYLEEAAAKKIATLYHGTNYAKALDDDQYVFLATDKVFAEDYGDIIFECQVDLGKVFESWKPENIKNLYAAGYKLTDDYITQSYDETDEIANYYDFENDYYPTAESFINGPFFDSDTWEAIEHTPEVTDWIFSQYDSIAILEGGHVNYYTSTDRIISKKQVEKTPRKMPWHDAVNEGYYTTWKKLGELGPLQYGENVDESSPIDKFEGKEAIIAKKLAKHFNIKKMAPLGSGTSGYAYYIPNNRVLKITKDKTEVSEAYKIKGRKLKHLANIYEVYELHGKYADTYVIISELLSHSEDIDYADGYLKDVLSEDHYHEELYYRNPYQLYERLYRGLVDEKQVAQIKKDILVYLKSHQVQVALWFLNGMLELFKELKKYKIQSTDWGLQNLGVKRDGSLAMFDLGYGDKNFPSGVQSIHLNEEDVLTRFDDSQYITKDGLAYADVEKNKDRWHISMIESKKRGNGTLIVQKIISDAKKAGVKKITLTTTEFSGFEFFDKLGFKEIGDNNDPHDIPMEFVLINDKLNEIESFTIKNFSDLTDDDLVKIANWGLEGDFSMSGCWDDNEDNLEGAIQCAVGDFKLFLKDKYPQGFNGISSEPIVYRFITAPNEESINKNKLGYSWFADPNQYKNNTEFFGQLMHLRKKHRLDGHKLFLISAKVPMAKIDIPRTLWQRSANWNENEIVLKDDANLHIIDIKDMSQELGEGFGSPIPSPTNHEYPDFFDGQNNPLFNDRAFPPQMNMNTAPLAETEISQEEINKKELPYKYSNLFDDFVTEKTEKEVREIAPALDLNQTGGMLMMNLETNYPSLFDNFADWIYNKLKTH